MFGSGFHASQAWDDYDRACEDGGYAPRSEGSFGKDCRVVAETEKAFCITGIATDTHDGARYAFENAWFPKTQVYGQPKHFKAGVKTPAWAVPPMIKSWLWHRKATAGNRIGKMR